MISIPQFDATHYHKRHNRCSKYALKYVFIMNMYFESTCPRSVRPTRVFHSHCQPEVRKIFEYRRAPWFPRTNSTQPISSDGDIGAQVRAQAEYVLGIRFRLLLVLCTGAPAPVHIISSTEMPMINERPTRSKPFSQESRRVARRISLTNSITFDIPNLPNLWKVPQVPFMRVA